MLALGLFTVIIIVFDLSEKIDVVGVISTKVLLVETGGIIGITGRIAPSSLLQDANVITPTNKAIAISFKFFIINYSIINVLFAVPSCELILTR